APSLSAVRRPSARAGGSRFRFAEERRAASIRGASIVAVGLQSRSPRSPESSPAERAWINVFQLRHGVAATTEANVTYAHAETGDQLEVRAREWSNHLAGVSWFACACYHHTDDEDQEEKLSGRADSAFKVALKAGIPDSYPTGHVEQAAADGCP